MATQLIEFIDGQTPLNAVNINPIARLAERAENLSLTETARAKHVEELLLRDIQHNKIHTNDNQERISSLESQHHTLVQDMGNLRGHVEDSNAALNTRIDTAFRSIENTEAEVSRLENEIPSQINVAATQLRNEFVGRIDDVEENCLEASSRALSVAQYAVRLADDAHEKIVDLNYRLQLNKHKTHEQQQTLDLLMAAFAQNGASWQHIADSGLSWQQLANLNATWARMMLAGGEVLNQLETACACG